MIPEGGLETGYDHSKSRKHSIYSNSRNYCNSHLFVILSACIPIEAVFNTLDGTRQLNIKKVITTVWVYACGTYP
jgi:hypothetical protein